MMEVHPTEVIRRRPVLAIMVLATGAVGYWLICVPAIGRRGYPEIDPFWLAMPKLWIVPIILSAVWEDRRGRRLLALASYSIVTGFIGSGTVVSIIPSYVTYQMMLVSTLFWGPLHFLISVILEFGTQRMLRRIRRFDNSPLCSRCGYCLLGLPQPRCPECGGQFDPQSLVPPPDEPACTVRSSRTARAVGVLLAATAAFPFGYRAICLAYASLDGRAAARRALDREAAIWYVTPEEEAALLNTSWDGSWPLLYQGLEVRRIHGGPEDRARMRGYRLEIEGKLRASKVP